MRLIDADALRNVFDAMHAIPGATHFDHLVLLGIKKCIDDTPPIDADPVRHGRWEWITNYGCVAHLSPIEPIEPYDAGWGCSVCGIDLVQYLKSHFPDIPSYLECACEEKPTLERCPNCGAKMLAKEADHAE